MADIPYVGDEAFYHFVWQHKLYRAGDLKTVDGLPLELIHPGFLNRNAGPDFFNAKIKIDGILWAGNVEIHCKSSDWQQHKHQEDAAYANVILHVAAHYTTPAFNSKGKEIPTLVLDIQPSVYRRYSELLEAKKDIACHSMLSGMEPIFLLNFRDRLVSERLQRKSRDIDLILQASQNDWEAVFFQTLCRNFGFGVNSDVFGRLGKSLSYRIIARHRDNLLQLEALFFGQAGFLKEEPEDTYQTQLKKEYNFLMTKYDLKPLDRHLWKFLRLRPSNFPTIRIAELAHLLHQNDGLLHRILETDINDMERLLTASTSAYWQTHYRFGKCSGQRRKTLGETAVRAILINTVAPLVFCYGKAKKQERLCEKAITILEQLPPERNHIISRWDHLGIKCRNAYDSQAQIQLYNEYCLTKKCLHCNIGHHFLSLRQ